MLTKEWIEHQIYEYIWIKHEADENFKASQDARFLEIQLKCLNKIEELQRELNNLENETNKRGIQ